MRLHIRMAICAVTVTSIACAPVSACEAADRFIRSVDTGYPRELINQLVCGTLESADGLQRCEIPRQ